MSTSDGGIHDLTTYGRTLVCDMQLDLARRFPPSEVGQVPSAVSPSAGWFHFDAGSWAATQRLLTSVVTTSVNFRWWYASLNYTVRRFRRCVVDFVHRYHHLKLAKYQALRRRRGSVLDLTSG